MGELLGLGVTHYPGLSGKPGRNASFFIDYGLQNPALPENLRTPAGWPEPMRREWADDKGAAAVETHRQALIKNLREARKALDDFNPDFVLIWGDDQYENFTEDIIPPFCVLAYDSVDIRPWSGESPAFGGNIWNEPEDKTFTVKVHQEAAKYLARGLLEAGIDVSYAYQPLHKPLGHAFINTVLFLDWDRKGFPYPILPVAVNCYGSRVISFKGFRGEPTAEPDPPGPSPKRCFEMGAVTGRLLAESPWRVALIASSSWSHANLASKNYYLYPDIESDRKLLKALKEGDYEAWKNRPLSAIEESGQQELLNWFPLMGAMAELGRRVNRTEWVESWVNNSPKCFAYFNP